MEFFDAVRELGFVASSERASRGSRSFSSHPNSFLTLWVHAYDDGSALFTWEFAITDYLLERGIQVGSSESLNLFMFPVEDDRGPQDAAWLAAAIDRADARLREVDFAEPG
jgi:hypothetical protein